MFKMITRRFLFPLAFSTAFGSLLIPARNSAADDQPEDAEFQPVVEAPVPEGFPGFTPVGEIQVKHYPAYRKAEAAGPLAFWTLFQHISDAGISMTAPVELTYQAESSPVGREQAMAFLYPDSTTGSTGRQGSVQVADVPAATVVSIGMRGGRSEAALIQAEKQLRTWLEQHSDRYQASGAVRVLGYNSPFIPSERQFYEVQIPIRERADSDSQVGLGP